ncbi:MAG: hypothetical protein FWD34_08740 [Oscillospiraceae bacterium]|nr:hypothetical protein [Oscillospiraceae bacterium]
MKYSELSKLDGDFGLVYNPETLTLTGQINGYSVVIIDDKNTSEFVLAVFADGDTHSLDFLPKNAIQHYKADGRLILFRFSSYPMSQENLPLLIDTINAVHGEATPTDMSLITFGEKPPKKPADAVKILKITITVCVFAAAAIVIFFAPTTVLQKSLIALAAGIMVYIFYFRKKP